MISRLTKIVLPMISLLILAPSVDARSFVYEEFRDQYSEKVETCERVGVDVYYVYNENMMRVARGYTSKGDSDRSDRYLCGCAKSAALYQFYQEALETEDRSDDTVSLSLGETEQCSAVNSSYGDFVYKVHAKVKPQPWNAKENFSSTTSSTTSSTSSSGQFDHIDFSRKSSKKEWFWIGGSALLALLFL